jgi:hypothetical protein
LNGVRCAEAGTTISVIAAGEMVVATPKTHSLDDLCMGPGWDRSSAATYVACTATSQTTITVDP